MKRRPQASAATGPFISYAREDQALVRRLHEELSRHGREPWVDWQGILPTEAWMRSIRDAIDAATAFVFILSPDSVASRVCTDEIDHAVAQHKRLIPVLYRQVDTAAVHAQLASLNWVVLRDGPSFEADVGKLIEALDLDLDWIRHHARLLVRAGEWSQRGREASLLLRGRDLQEAQAWLSQAGSSATRVATDAQAQYIAASAQDAVRRQRRNIAILAAGLVVAVGLALLAWQQRNQARAQRDLANSRLLASQSAAQRDRHLDLSLLLAVEAQRIAPTAEARTSLLQAAQLRPQLLRYLSAHHARVDRLLFARQGTLLAAGDQDLNTSLWESGSGRRLLWIDAQRGDTSALALSRDGRWLARGRDDGGVVMRDTSSGGVTTLRTTHGAVGALALGDEGDVLAVGAHDGSVSLLTRATGILHCEFAPTPRGAVSDLWMAPDGRILSRHGWHTWLWTSQDCGASARQLPDPNTAFVALDWQRGTLIGSEPGPPNLKLIDLAGGQTTDQRPAYSDYALALAFLGPTIAVGSRDGTIVFWDAAKRTPTRTRLSGHASAIHSLAADDQGRWLASGALDGDILLWDLATAPPAAPKEVMLRHAGGRLWRLYADGKLSAADGSASVEVGGRVLDFALSTQGRLAAVRLERGTIKVFDPTAPTTQRSITAPPMQAGLALHPSEPLLALASSNDVIVWHTERLVELARLTGHKGPVSAIAFSPDGNLLVSAAQDNTLRLWNTSRWDLRAQWPRVSERYVRSLAFDAQSRRLAAGGGMEDGTVTVWDIATGRRLFAPLRTDEVDVTQVAFDADGELLAAANFTGGTFVWHLGTLQPVAKLPSAPTLPEVGAVLAFRTDELTVATAQGALTWPLHIDTWQQRACRLANRSLTREEWTRYLPDYDYRLTCG